MTNATSTLLLVTGVAVGGFGLLASAAMGATVAGGRIRRYLRTQRSSSELRVRRSS
jgi:hypothetical protein